MCYATTPHFVRPSVSLSESHSEPQLISSNNLWIYVDLPHGYAVKIESYTSWFLPTDKCLPNVQVLQVLHLPHFQFQKRQKRFTPGAHLWLVANV